MTLFWIAPLLLCSALAGATTSAGNAQAKFAQAGDIHFFYAVVAENDAPVTALATQDIGGGQSASKSAASPDAARPARDSSCLEVVSAPGLKIFHGLRARPVNATSGAVDANGLVEVTAEDNACPISARQKFVEFLGEAVSPLTFMEAAGSAGISQATNRYPEFEQGGEGYARRFGAALADSESEDFFTTFLFPALLREDPRYFRKVTGGFGARSLYAASRVLITRTDGGSKRFNFSQILGTLASAGLSNAYYRQRQRTAGKTFERAGIALGTDAGFNVLKEFVPGFWRKAHSPKN